MQYTIEDRTERAQLLNDRAGPSAKIRIYSGAKPATANAAATGTLLAELIGDATEFGVAYGGALTANPFTSGSALADGDAGYYRLCSADGTVRGQGTAGLSGSGAEMILTKTALTEGMAVNCTSFVITMGGA